MPLAEVGRDGLLPQSLLLLIDQSDTTFADRATLMVGHIVTLEARNFQFAGSIEHDMLTSTRGAFSRDDGTLDGVAR